MYVARVISEDECPSSAWVVPIGVAALDVLLKEAILSLPCPHLSPGNDPLRNGSQ
jgi:hypothetical protein